MRLRRTRLLLLGEQCMRLALMLAFLAVTACQPASEDVAAAPAAEDHGADDPGLPEEPAPDPTPVTFEPLSRTAEAFTGSVSLNAQPRRGPNATPAMRLSSSTGLVYETSLLPGGAEQASGVDWQAIFGAEVVSAANPPPGAPSIDVHLVQEERVPPGAPNGGLCGADKTFGIAMATGLAGAAGPMMSIAAFRGEVWPPEDESALCGTFNYAPPARPASPR